jgi:spore coat polysaccharide biosynthesis protein SpsF
MMKYVVVVQARTGSTRFPNKVMLPLGGRPLLERMLERLARTPVPLEIIVATTWNSEDEPIRMLCSRLDVPCYSGHPTDLLDRHYRVGKHWRADAVVKIPSDCPLIDPGIVGRVLQFATDHDGEYDYVSNLHPPTYPDGNDVEVIPFAVLEEAWHEADRPFEREHTTPFIWEQPERYRIGNVRWETGWNYSMSHRWTIDYPEDYLFLKVVFEELWKENPGFSLMDILSLLQLRPEIRELNAEHVGVNWYRDHSHELKTITPDQFRQVS